MPVHVLADRVQETTTTTGTGPVSLAGATAQSQTFIAAVGDGNECDYIILCGDGVNWETGTTNIHAGSPPTLTRDHPLTSTNGGAVINLTGTSTVFLAPTAPRIYGRFGRRPTRPALANFTWNNQGTAAAKDYTNGPLTLMVPPPTTGADSWRSLVQVPPTAPWAMTVEFESLQWMQSYNNLGLIVIDSAGKAISLFLQQTTTVLEVIINWYNSVTSYNANKFSQNINPMGVYWLRIYNDGTYLNFMLSPNGADWVTVQQQLLTAWLGATISYVGFSGDCSAIATPANMLMNVWSFELVSGTGSNVQWI